MGSKVLWALDNEIDGGSFERLCTDLLLREGFKSINPLGGNYDGGRDAEIVMFQGVKSSGGTVFFQYSLENNWEAKLKRELKKVHLSGHKINYYVFVTSRKVTGKKREEYKKNVAIEYGWQLLFFDREWLRSRLEVAHPDLAAKYLGFDVPDVYFNANYQKPAVSEQFFDELAFQLYIQGKYEYAAIAFKTFLVDHQDSSDAWQLLSWCQYTLFRYDEALYSIEQALSLEKGNHQSLRVKACILTEEGIKRGYRANIIQGKEIFQKLCESSKEWTDFYNLGNALHALGAHEEAIIQYQMALSLDSTQPIIWKNLGTAFFHLHNHEEELRCYDQALEIDPENPEALASKGVTLITVYKDYKTAITLISQAIELDTTVHLHWNTAWYWLSRGYYELGDLTNALHQADIGLGYAPQQDRLLDLKSVILAKLWREDNSFIETAQKYFEFRLALSPNDSMSFAELTEIYGISKMDDSLNCLIANLYGVKIEDFSQYLGLTDHTLQNLLHTHQFLSLYRLFRESSPITDYLELFKDAGFIADKDLNRAMYTIFSIPFCLSYELMSTLQSLDDRCVALPRLYTITQRSFSISLPRLSRKLAKSINLNEPREARISSLTHLMVDLSLVALVELSRQIGWIGGHFEIPVKHMEKWITKNGKKISKWQGQIAADIFLEVQEKVINQAN